MNSHLKAVVFDRDGVIAKYDLQGALAYLQPLLPIGLDGLWDEWNNHGNQRGWPQNLKDEKSFFQGFWAELGQKYLLNSATQQQLESFSYLDFMVAFPEVQSVFEQIRARGYRIGVLSNFTLASLWPSLQALNLDNFVNVACAAPIIGVAKPDIRAYQTIAYQLSVDTSECLFFDDETTCVTGAIRAGMTAYHVAREVDTCPSALPTVHNLVEVLGILDS